MRNLYDFSERLLTFEDIDMKFKGESFKDLTMHRDKQPRPYYEGHRNIFLNTQKILEYVYEETNDRESFVSLTIQHYNEYLYFIRHIPDLIVKNNILYHYEEEGIDIIKGVIQRRGFLPHQLMPLITCKQLEEISTLPLVNISIGGISPYFWKNILKYDFNKYNFLKKYARSSRVKETLRMIQYKRYGMDIYYENNMINKDDYESLTNKERLFTDSMLNMIFNKTFASATSLIVIIQRYLIKNDIESFEKCFKIVLGATDNYTVIDLYFSSYYSRYTNILGDKFEDCIKIIIREAFRRNKTFLSRMYRVSKNMTSNSKNMIDLMKEVSKENPIWDKNLRKTIFECNIKG